MDKNKFINYYKVKALDSEHTIFYSEDETPAHKFKSIFIWKNDFIININVRDFSYIYIILELAKKISGLPIVYNSTEISKISNLDFIGLHFDSLLLLPPEYHIMGYEEPEELYFLEKTIVAFPIYHCEFSGNEDFKDIKYMRKYLVSTIDWKRQISPKIYFKYNNYLTKSRTKGNRFYLDNMRSVGNEIENLKDPQSFIEIKNYEEKTVLLKSESGLIHVILEDIVVFTGNVENAKNYIWNYLTQ